MMKSVITRDFRISELPGRVAGEFSFQRAVTGLEFNEFDGGLGGNAGSDTVRNAQTRAVTDLQQASGLWS